LKYCKICGRQFVPNKHKPSQGACNDERCQRERQRQNVREWRQKNPDYFKYTLGTDETYKEMIRKKQLLWRKNNPLKVKEYRERYKEKTRRYMKDYKREYRKRKSNTQDSH